MRDKVRTIFHRQNIIAIRKVSHTVIPDASEARSAAARRSLRSGIHQPKFFSESPNRVQ
jgi:putative heme iron utilization protein